jgi:hypothetical protein
MARQIMHPGQRLTPCQVLVADRIESFGPGNSNAVGRRRD